MCSFFLERFPDNNTVKEGDGAKGKTGSEMLSHGKNPDSCRGGVGGAREKHCGTAVSATLIVLYTIVRRDGSGCGGRWRQGSTLEQRKRMVKE